MRFDFRKNRRGSVGRRAIIIPLDSSCREKERDCTDSRGRTAKVSLQIYQFNEFNYRNFHRPETLGFQLHALHDSFSILVKRSRINSARICYRQKVRLHSDIFIMNRVPKKPTMQKLIANENSKIVGFDERDSYQKCEQAGTGPSRCHIQGSKIAKRLPIVKYSFTVVENRFFFEKITY